MLFESIKNKNSSAILKMMNSTFSKQKIEDYQKLQKNKPFGALLVESLMVTGEENPDILIDYHKKMNKMDRFLGRTNIIIGPRGIGKTSFVYHALRKEGHTKIIVIDCVFNSRVEDIVNSMIFKLSDYVYTNKLQKNMIMDDQLDFTGLDVYLKQCNSSFLFVIKNAEKLVVNKRQIILYNFFEWIKNWEAEKKIGLVLITSNLDFMNKLEKRVKSRLNHSIINLMPRHQDIDSPKQMICARIKLSSKSKLIKQATNKISQSIMKNKKLDEHLLQSARSPCRRPQFYLQLFKLIFAIKFNSLNAKDIIQMNNMEIQKLLVEGFITGYQHMPTVVDKTSQNLKCMNYPEYIVMAIVRKMINEGKNSLRFKEILHQYKSMKPLLGSGSSFNYSDEVMQNAVRKLKKMRILIDDNSRRDNDFKNNELWSELAPDSILQVLNSVQNTPEILKKILN